MITRCSTITTLAGQSGIDARGLMYIALLIALCLVGFIIIVQVKRRIFDDQPNRDQSSATLMESLDQMRRTGQISEDEYQRTRRSIIEKTRAMLDPDSTDSDQ